MSRLDRDLQRRILEQLADAYPSICKIRPTNDETQQDIDANIYYLLQHELVQASDTLILDGSRRIGPPCITAKGLDFLADDGGLSSILGVVTIKLHDDTIRDLLIRRVEQAEGAPSVKEALIHKISKLPADALGKLTMDGLDVALSKAPDLIDMMSQLIPR